MNKAELMQENRDMCIIQTIDQMGMITAIYGVNAVNTQSVKNLGVFIPPTDYWSDEVH